MIFPVWSFASDYCAALGVLLCYSVGITSIYIGYLNTKPSPKRRRLEISKDYQSIWIVDR
jgi:hypothetical protein